MCMQASVIAKIKDMILNDTGQVKETQGTTVFQILGWHKTIQLRNHYLV